MFDDEPRPFDIGARRHGRTWPIDEAPCRSTNTAPQQTGVPQWHLVESRYKSSLVQQEFYLRACCRCVELNPVRAQMIAMPEAYRWSSCRSRLGLEPAPLFDEDSREHGLYANDTAWCSQWREYLASAVQMNEMNLIRAALQRGQLTGNDKFTDDIAGIIGRRVELRGRGRPPGKGYGTAMMSGN